MLLSVVQAVHWSQGAQDFPALIPYGLVQAHPLLQTLRPAVCHVRKKGTLRLCVSAPISAAHGNQPPLLGFLKPSKSAGGI
mmetsp:Transcript_63743/g.105247  ORF Transcript_63743/g.105247 Transcript_63743/m.105247 type:complete len:81 (+) Transcript_63743:85-327(+)